MKTLLTTLKLLVLNILLTFLFFFLCTLVNGRTYTGKNGFSTGFMCLLWSLIFLGQAAFWFRNDNRETRLAIYINLALNVLVFTAFTIEEYWQYHRLFD